MDQVSKNLSEKIIHFCTLTLIIILTSLTACKTTPPPFISPAGQTPAPGETVVASRTPFPPTASSTPTNTPIPLALIVNGGSITQEEYEASLSRLLAANPTLPNDQARNHVLDEFIDQLLLSQAATQAGFTVDNAMLQDRIQTLIDQIGGQDVLNGWIAANGYTEDLFRLELQRSVAAAWMRDQIIADVPTTTEQVHARQLLLFSADEANSVFTQLQNGVTFEVMLAYYDPIGLGDLGWFPRGYLNEPAIEETAFALNPGAYSSVIETSIGFHIIQLLERQSDRPLDPAVLLTIQEKALNNWLEQQRTTSNITVLTQ